MKSKILIILLCLITFFTSCSQKEKTCIITGRIINRPQSKDLRLTKAFVDFRSQTAILIPIKDSIFTYKFNYKDNEAYNLVFEDEYNKGSMRPITFFTTDGIIDMKLYPMQEYNKNIIKGGDDNNEFIKYQQNRSETVMSSTKSVNDSIGILMANDEYNSQIMKELYIKLKITTKDEDRYKMYNQINDLYKSKEGLSPSAKRLENQKNLIMNGIQNKEIEHIKKNITIPNYFLLIQLIINMIDNPDMQAAGELKSIQERYSIIFKNHPYTKYSNEVIWRMTNMKPGGDYFDFSLPDINGKEYTLSKEIKGKYAFVDIWAPWCGPCISKSREMKPLFEEYKNKGFTVIGIASKYQELSDVNELLEKDDYPWITLIDKPELDSRINQHYGIEMAGGGCVLVDKTGKLLLVNPSVEDVKKILETNL